jgi:UDP-GlcNAc:undecaprenyl-phosphate GlcNAc-1-phosphate transferase
VYIFAGAFVVAFIFTPLMRRVAVSWGIVDKPDGVRKSHTQATAYLGGLAVFVGWVVGLALSLYTRPHDWAPGLEGFVFVPPAVMIGALVVVTLGFWDDLRGLTPKVKILGQVAAALTLVFSGVGATLTEPFVVNVVARLDAYVFTVPEAAVVWATWITSVMLTVALVVFCCNAANLMDGLDGLCGGVTAVIAGGFVILAATVALRGGLLGAEELRMDGARLAIGLALLGAVLGFLPFNFNPASIFMGDAGSLFLGFTCATLIIMLGEVQAKWLLAAMVMFALPVLDTALAFARRWVNGRPLFSADKFHFHHQLRDRNLSVKQAVLIEYALAVFFVICGVLIVFMQTRFAFAFYLVLFGYIGVAAYKIGMIHERRPDQLPTATSNGNGQAPEAKVAHSRVTDLQSPLAAADAPSAASRDAH